MSKPKIVFLYTELAGYLVACINELVRRDVEVHIVRWPVNAEAPFKFHFEEGVTIHERDKYQGNLSDLLKGISPSAILCSGWVDKEYLSATRKWRGRIPTVLLLDNQWTGSLKQKLSAVAGTFMITPTFSHAWVPGTPQEQFALKLGFKKNRIRRGFYCADLEKFNAVYTSSFPHKKENFPKKLLYVGRYLPFKGINMLWNVFTELVDEGFSDWELQCLGTGDLWEERAQHPNIHHAGFVQPDEMGSYLSSTGVFVLPSTKEPWGVVVQEMAAAGFPIVCSDKVGAASSFLENGENGFTFHSGDSASLKKALKQIMSSHKDELIGFGEKSHALAQKVNPELWASTLLELL